MKNLRNFLLPFSFFIVMEFLAYDWLYPKMGEHSTEDFISATIIISITSIIILIFQLNTKESPRRKRHTVIQYVVSALVLIPNMWDTGSIGLGIWMAWLYLTFILTPINILFYDEGVYSSIWRNVFKKEIPKPLFYVVSAGLIIYLLKELI